MLTVPPFPTNDNDRYPDARPTALHDYLSRKRTAPPVRAPHTEVAMTNDDRPRLTSGYAYRPGDAPAYWNFGTYWQLLATSDNTGGRSTTFDELYPQGSSHHRTSTTTPKNVLHPGRRPCLHPRRRRSRRSPLPRAPTSTSHQVPDTRSLRLHDRAGLQHPCPRRLRPRHHRQRHAPAPRIEMPPPGTSAAASGNRSWADAHTCHGTKGSGRRRCVLVMPRLSGSEFPQTRDLTETFPDQSRLIPRSQSRSKQ